MIIREITQADDEKIVVIIRKNLKNSKLDIPGTAYFDPELEHLSDYYLPHGDIRKYYIMTDEDGTVVGGAGFSKFDEYDNCVEMQKLYLSDEVKGRGYGKMLVNHIEEAARSMGFKKMYLETHSNLDVAMKLYSSMRFVEISKPDFVKHGAMDHFYIKELD